MTTFAPLLWNRRTTLRFAALLLALSPAGFAQVNPNLFAGLKWRNIGPFRGGRISAVAGSIAQPGVFYAAASLGGVWKTVSAGATWFNITDSVPEIANVTALEVAPSDPKIVYLGTGDHGLGMYKSYDAGLHWERIGLQNHGISTILVDPHEAKLVLAATEGDPRAKSDQRGIFRSTDGGTTWTRVLYKDEETGASGMVWAFDNPAVVFATMAPHYTAPGAAPAAIGGAGGGSGGENAGGPTLYKSTDEGLTWKELKPSGLPAVGELAVAQHTNSQRLYSLSRGGLFHSEDGGVTWTPGASEIYTARGHVYVDSKDPNVVYTMGTSAYRSTDGGRTLVAFKGAPGGDDPREWWLDPVNPDRILYGGDQGACVSLDGGHTWSSWYNQPTAQVYKIAVDNRFPYWVYGSQQDSGVVATRSRGDLGEITPFDWFPAPGWEAGFIAPDPADPNILYTNGNYGDLARVEIDTWHQQIINPAVGPSIYRRAANAPIVFSPQDPHTMYWATQFVMRTKDAGRHFEAISPDLSVRAGQQPVAGPATGRSGPAITALAVSPAKAGVMWTGSNTGALYVTQDGGAHWKDVTPTLVRPGSLMGVIEASHQDAATAYAIADRSSIGDERPYIYRTMDYGRSWQVIVTGLPDNDVTGSFVRVVREDPAHRGLLFAGTETSVYVSFDGGDHWQSLRLNLPTTSYRDLAIHGNDLVAGTYGRSFFVLDDISPLRQISPALAAMLSREPSYLFGPGAALRVRRDINMDTPLPPEVPHAQNPPEGALLYYYLGAKPAGEIKLEIYDAQNKLVRTLSSTPPPGLPEPLPPVPDYWLRKPQPLTVNIGTNRAIWDLHYDDPPALSHNWGQAMPAIFQDTPYTPQGPLALPGKYTVKLIVDGRTAMQELTVHEDPRIVESPALMAELRAQLDLEQKNVAGMAASYTSYQQTDQLRTQLKVLSGAGLPAEVAQALTALDAKVTPVQGLMSAAASGPYGVPAYTGNPGFTDFNGAFAGLMVIVDYMSDHAPVDAQVKAYHDYCVDLNANLARWRAIGDELPALNVLLRKNNLRPLNRYGPPHDLDCGPVPAGLAPAPAR